MVVLSVTPRGQRIDGRSPIRAVGAAAAYHPSPVAHFRSTNGRAICVALVGISRALRYLSFEGQREFPTDGKTYRHPVQEAEDAENRLVRRALPVFDEFILLRFRATNVPPYPFEWVNEAENQVQYAAALARISREYEVRF